VLLSVENSPALGYAVTGGAEQFYLSPENRGRQPWSPTLLSRSPFQDRPAHVLPSNIPRPPRRSNIRPPRSAFREDTPATCNVQARTAAADTPCLTATGLGLHHEPYTLSSQRCQRLFHALSNVLFIFRSRYLFAIGLGAIFSLRRSTPPFCTALSNCTTLGSQIHLRKKTPAR